MSKQERSDKLISLGWLQGYATGQAVPDVALDVARAAYAAFHGVANDWATIEQHWQQPRCALPDMQQQVGELNKWDNPDITWAIINDLPGLSRQDFESAAATAFGYWATVCGIRPKKTNDPNTANVVITVGNIDGPSGTLAWSELPNRGTRRVTQKYDSSERKWVISLNPSGGALDITRVLAHEIGHAVGIFHISAGNLLAPTYSLQVHKPMSGDVAEATARYGPPVAQPTPIPTPNPQPTPGGSTMLGTLLKLLPLIAKFLPQIIQYLPDIIKLIEELSKIFKANPAAIDAFVAELKAADTPELRQSMTAQAFTGEDIADLLKQLIELLRSLAAAVGVHVRVGPKVTVDVDVKKEQPK